MKTACLTTAYLAPISYYSILYHCEQPLVETACNYIKQTYRNRCNIVGANGVMPLSVPVEKPDTLKCLTRDIRISDHGNWQHLHWNAIKSAYNSTPFFEYYQDDFVSFFKKKYDFLFDLNEELRQTVCDLLTINTQAIYTDSYQDYPNDGEVDFRDRIHPKKNPAETDPTFIPVPYYQVFEHKFGFISDMSIIDLLFNMGPESLLVLKNSRPATNKKR